MHVGKKSSSDDKKYPPGSFMGRLKERKIIATLAAFIGGGWLTYEIVHWILVEHYHLPHELEDITIVSFLGALLSTVIWLWFRGAEKRSGNVKVEVLVVPLIILLALVIDLKFIFVMTSVSISMLLIGIVALCLGIAWVVFKSLQWAASAPEAEKKAEVLKPVEEKPISFPEWKNSIAVLPFKNVSADPEQEYFCDGITEELINTLTQVKDLRVVARTSAFSFKGKDIDIREIGKTLNVNKVLEGSVRKAENRVRITAQLVNVADGYDLWSAKYDRDMEDIFDIQDAISLAIVDKLKVKLLRREKDSMAKRYTDDIEAYNLYLKGIHSWRLMTAKGLEEAIECFQQALQKDPNYALAYDGLASVEIVSVLFSNVPPHDGYQRAREYAQKALEIDKALGEAHATLGLIHTFHDWNWSEAEKEFKQALELSPNNAENHIVYSNFLTISEQHEVAIVETNRAQELDPLSSYINAERGSAFLFAGQFDRAIEELRKALKIAPDYHYLHFYLGFCYVGKSKFEEAIEEFEKAGELSGGIHWMVMVLAITYHEMGKEDEAEKLFESLKKRSRDEYVPPICFFYMHLVRGEKDKALEWLERACKEHDSFLLHMRVFPVDSFRIPDEPTYQNLLKKYGLE